MKSSGIIYRYKIDVSTDNIKMTLRKKYVKFFVYKRPFQGKKYYTVEMFKEQEYTIQGEETRKDKIQGTSTR